MTNPFLLIYIYYTFLGKILNDQLHGKVTGTNENVFSQTFLGLKVNFMWKNFSLHMTPGPFKSVLLYFPVVLQISLTR